MHFPIRAVKDSSLTAAIPAPWRTFASGLISMHHGFIGEVPRPPGMMPSPA